MREELMSSIITDWIEGNKLIINEGEERCPFCHGEKGYVFDNHWSVCKQCKGNGKIDWIRKAMIS
jgi:DnaJ-class molecular chaperone